MHNLCILIPSCDRYQDVWGTLIDSIHKYSKSELPKIYLQTNRKKPKYIDCSVLAVGRDVSWSDNVLKALDSIEEEYVLLWIDDLILIDEVDWVQLRRRIQWFFEEKGAYLRLNPTPAGQDKNEKFSLVPQNDYYRTSTVFSIWRKSVLKQILMPGESPWQLEIAGSRRSECFEKWYASTEHLVPFVNLIIKGTVHPRSLEQVHNAGLKYDSKRKIMTRLEYYKYTISQWKSKAFSLLPPSVRGYRYLFK